MAITQLSAFLANEPGTLYQAISTVSDAGINLRALSVADTRDFGILRIIVSDPDKARQALEENWTVTATKIIAVKMSDQAGALKDILQVLQEAGINIEYVYAFTTAGKDAAYVALRVNDIEEAEVILKKNGKVTLSDESLKELL